MPDDCTAAATCPAHAHYVIASQCDLHLAILAIATLAPLRAISAIDRALLMTIATELGTNMIKYAGRGLLRVTCDTSASAVLVDIEAEDHGPGIADIDLALRDHYSSGHGLGLGLSGVRRIADRFTIGPGWRDGTVVRARKRVDLPGPSRP